MKALTVTEIKNSGSLNEGKFWRLDQSSKDKLYVLKNELDSLYSALENGNDLDINVLKSLEKDFKTIMKGAKEFKSKDDVIGTVYEDNLNEGASGVRVKRGYTDYHPEVKAGAKGPMRGAILEFVKDNPKCTYEELNNFIKSTNENDQPGGNNTSMKWVKNNSKYFNESTKNGVTTFKLSNTGKRVVEQLHPTSLPLAEGSISELELLRKHTKSKDNFIKDGYGIVKTKGKWTGKKSERSDIEKYLSEYFDSMVDGNEI